MGSGGMCLTPAFLASTIDGSEWLASRPGQERIGGWWAPEPVLTLWSRDKSLSPAGNRTPAAQHVARRYCDWAITARPGFYLMLPLHIAEHSPRDLQSGCVDSVLALARRMFGIRPESERRYVWCRFFCSASKDALVPTRATRLHIARGTRRGSNLYIFHLHLLSLEWQASGVIAMCGRVHSAMCGGSGPKQEGV
jgi:hypothetical protein